MKRGGGLRFVRAYTKVIRDTRISREARFLYVALKSYADASGSCFPSFAKLAADIGTGRRQVIRWMKELESFRVISKAPRMEGGLQSSNQYSIEDEHFARFLVPKKRQASGDSAAPLGE